jgi:hypothetical protein
MVEISIIVAIAVFLPEIHAVFKEVLNVVLGEN